MAESKKKTTAKKASPKASQSVAKSAKTVEAIQPESGPGQAARVAKRHHDSHFG